MQRRTMWIIGFLAFILCGIVAFFLFSKNQTSVIFEQATDQEVLSPGGDTSTHHIDTPQVSDQVFREILPTDCANECQTFENSPNEYVYCQNVCGLTPANPSNLPTSIANQSLEQDIQQKNTAIQEGDLSNCETIKDAALRKNCQVRITEDLLEK